DISDTSYRRDHLPVYLESDPTKENAIAIALGELSSDLLVHPTSRSMAHDTARWLLGVLERQGSQSTVIFSWERMHNLKRYRRFNILWVNLIRQITIHYGERGLRGLLFCLHPPCLQEKGHGRL